MTAWNDFRGAAKRLEDIDLPRIGARIGVGEDEVHALIEVEAAGSGFDATGRPKMLFEPHVFYRNLSGAKRERAVAEGLAYKKWKSGGYPKDSYPRLAKAMAIDETAALMAASWGLAQILGENYALAGFTSVQAMVKAFMADEDNHLEAMIEFVVAAGIDDDLKAHRWAAVAAVYNGPGYRKHNYDGRLKAAYAKWAKIRDTEWNGADEEDAPPEAAAPDLRAVQQRLLALGYTEVGTVDGKRGTKTEAAILAFRNDNGLPAVADVDEVFLAALMTATPRAIAPARAAATIADLRQGGSEVIKATDVQKGGAALVTGTSVVGGIAKVLNEAGSDVGQLTDALSPFQAFMAFFADWFWVPVVMIAIVIGIYAIPIARARLRDHRTGNTAVVNLPAQVGMPLSPGRAPRSSPLVGAGG